MDSKCARSSVRDCATQLPHRYRWHDQNLAGRRLRSHSPDGFDGNLLRWRRLTDTYPNGYGYSHADSDAHTDSNPYIDVTYSNSHAHADSYADGHVNSYSNSYIYSHAYGNTNTDFNTNSYCNRYSNVHPVYGEVFTDTKASANSGAAPVVSSVY